MLILFWLTLFILILFPAVLDFLAWPYHDHEQFYEGLEDTRIHRFLMFIMFEFALIFTYIFGALICRWILNIGPITPMAFNRWIIEACYAPMIVEIVVYVLFRYPFIECPNVVSASFHAHFAWVIRLFLFLITRYAEFYPSARLNNVQFRTFHITCNTSTHNNSSDFQASEFSLYHFENLTSY